MTIETGNSSLEDFLETTMNRFDAETFEDALAAIERVADSAERELDPKRANHLSESVTKIRSQVKLLLGDLDANRSAAKGITTKLAEVEAYKKALAIVTEASIRAYADD